MNLKYYLRGLGLGIVVTAVIMGVVSGGKKEVLTNEEIIARAKTLGMVENKVLTEYEEEVQGRHKGEDTEDSNNTPAKEEEIVNESEQIDTEADKETGDGTAEEVQESDGNGTAQGLGGEGTTETVQGLDGDRTVGMSERTGGDGVAGTTQTTEPIAFQVKRGESTHDISKRLAEMELISSVDEFKKYLRENKYDRKIVAAKYEIPSNADEETIARIITGEKISSTEESN